jgi:uncharacterized protein Yka (UPF0111/DUF47 family)
MWLDRAIKWLLPREEHFFDLLNKLAQAAHRGALLLVECVHAPDLSTREAIVTKIKGVEADADKVIVEVYQELNRTFVTPIDRSDIYNLGSELENITDLIYSTALQVVVHSIDELPSGSTELAHLIQKATLEVVSAVVDIPTKNSHLEVRKHCKNIKDLENEGDRLFRTETAKMFNHETDAIRLLKHKEFLEGLEETLDLCDDVAGILSTIVIKNS